MKITYCTIITADFIHYALTLNESLLLYNADSKLKILISDFKNDFSIIAARYPNIEFFFVDQLCNEGIAKLIYEKYAHTDMDCFRWSMKPVFIRFLLNQGYDQVFFLDSDIYFFAPFDFLSDDLNGSDVLLTPHWRASDPKKDETGFAVLQTSGLFNAGFIGASKQGIRAMDWWADVCIYRCEKASHEGLYDDQAYLDLLPIYFDNIKIEKHRGCNVANWNQVECKRIITKTGKIEIQGGYEIIFIHFTKCTIDGIISGKDYLLRPYLDEYNRTLDRLRCWVQDTLEIKNKELKLSADRIAGRIKDKKIPQNNIKVQHSFLNPKLSPENLDLYIVRDSILNAMKKVRGELKGTVLDVGCGNMPYKPLLLSDFCEVTRYIGLDLEKNPIYDNNPDITWKEGKIPLPDHSIDCAIATEVFEHCSDPEAVMKEIHRVLKPDGSLFFTVPFLWPLHEVPYDNYRYTPFSLERHLAASGFMNIQLESLGGWDSSLAQMLGLWVRNRGIGKLKRRILSAIFIPFISLLYKKDKEKTTFFQANTMITGISGIAKKAADDTCQLKELNK